MRLVVTADERFVGTPDGAVWTTGTFAHSFWQRYLSAFDEVGVLARVLPVATAPAGSTRVDGPGVRVHALPHYIGPAQFLRKRRAIQSVVDSAVSRQDAVLLRAPSTIATLVSSILADRGQPYAVDVVADPYDVFAPGAVRHPLRPFLRRWFTGRLRDLCSGAVAVSYVTQHALQRRYPAAPGAYTDWCSDVELNEDSFVARARTSFRRDGHSTLVLVGSLAQLYKGPDLLIRAVAALNERGLAVHAVLVGDGRCRPAVESLARRLGVEGSVTFAGQVAGGAAVRSQLDRADVFVLPSRCEGLPKALLEAMARGLPCVTSSVGGMPELLAPQDLVPPGDIEQLAARLYEVLADEDRLRSMAARNLARAHDFSQDKLQPRRESFCHALRVAASGWTVPASSVSDGAHG